MPEPTGRLLRSERLKLSKDYQRVARTGRRHASRFFVVLIAPARSTSEASYRGRAAERRLGITASRKVGGAVVRNRVKRSVREWFRGRRSQLEENVDIVVIARRGAGNLASHEIHGVLDRLMLARSEATS